jgi:hypothetical protein
MERKLLEKLIYEKPEIKMFPMEIEQFVCTSVEMRNPLPANSEEEWEEDEKDMGEYEI